MMKTRVGTPLFLSPEVVMRRPYCAKVDVWAMGCLMYTLMALKAPFTGHNLIDLAQAITKKAPQRLPDVYSKELRYTVGQMLRKDPTRRPSVTEVLGFVPDRITSFYEQFPRAIEIPKSVLEAKKKAQQGSAGASSTVSRASSTPMSMPSEPTLLDQEPAEVGQGRSFPTERPSPVSESQENNTVSPVPSESCSSRLLETPEDSAVPASPEHEAAGPKGGVDERLAASRARPSSAGTHTGKRGNKSRAGPAGTTVPWEKRLSTNPNGLQRPGSAGSRAIARRHQRHQQWQQQPQQVSQEPWPDRLQKPSRWQGPQVSRSSNRPTAVTATVSPSSCSTANTTQATAAAAKPQTLLLEHPSEELTEEATRPTRGGSSTAQTSLVAVGGGSFTLVVNQPSAVNSDGAANGGGVAKESASSLEVPSGPVLKSSGDRSPRTRATEVQAAESTQTLAVAPAPATRVRPSSAHPTSRAQALAAAKQRQAHAAAAYSNSNSKTNTSAARLVRPQSAGFRRPGSAGVGRSSGPPSSLAVRSGFAQNPRAAWSPQQLAGHASSVASESRGAGGSGEGSRGLRNSVGRTTSLLGELAVASAARACCQFPPASVY